MIQEKLMKKIFTLIALCLLGAALFAYDGTTVGGIDGTYTRITWDAEAQKTDVAKAVVQANFEGAKISKLFMVTADNQDAEDLKVIKDVEEIIDSEYGKKNKTGYSHIVLRGYDDKYADGWVVLSHYTNAKGFYHYVYYYSVSF